MRHLPHIAENELIAQCKTGNLKYQEILYHQYYSFAMAIGLRYSINRDDALEAVNDAFIKVFKKISSYDATKPFKAWLSTIVINTAIDRRRTPRFSLTGLVERKRLELSTSAMRVRRSAS